MDIPVPWDAKVGKLIECENCAGVLFRIQKEGDQDLLQLVQLVSCPFCEERIPVDGDSREGTVIPHRGAVFKLVKEFGAYTLELSDGENPSCVPTGNTNRP